MQDSDAATRKKKAQNPREVNKRLAFLVIIPATRFITLTNKLMDTVLRRHVADQLVGF